MAEVRVSVEHPGAASPAPAPELPAVNEVRMSVETANGKQWPDLFRYGAIPFPIRPAWEESTDPAPQLRLLDSIFTCEEPSQTDLGQSRTEAPRIEGGQAAHLAPRLTGTAMPAVEPGPVKLAQVFQPVTAAPTQVRLPNPEATAPRPPAAFVKQPTTTAWAASAAPAPPTVRRAEPVRTPPAVRPAVSPTPVRPAAPPSSSPAPPSGTPVRPSPVPVVVRRAPEAPAAAPSSVHLQPAPAAPLPPAVAPAASVTMPPSASAESPKAPAVAETIAVRPAPKPEPTPAERVETETFHLAVSESHSPVLKIALILGIVFVLVIAVFLTTGRKQGNRDNGEVAESLMVVGAGWNSEVAEDDAGSKVFRQFSLYRPTMQLADYRVAFTGEIERRAIGWVFRFADLRNYYGMKVAVGGGKATLVRYSMVDGVENGRTEIPLSRPVHLGGSVDIKLDIRGIRFTTYVQGEAADFWTDDRIRTGGFGFANERDERAKITAVQISVMRGGVK